MLQATATAAIEVELDLLRSGAVDAVCIGSPEEANLIIGGDDWPRDAKESGPLVIALGKETATAARAAASEGTTVVELGAREDDAAAVDAMEAHFGAGRLLF